MHPEKKFAAARARERMCPPSTSLGTPTHTWKQVPLDFARDTTSWSDEYVPLDLARDTTSWSDVVEAGGVEPPSEKPCHQKTTCLARSGRRSPLRVCGEFAGARSEGARNASG